MATGALSNYVTKEDTNKSQWIGLIVGFIGVVITVAFRIDFTKPGSFIGYFLPSVSVVAITFATLIQRRLNVNDQKEKLPVDQTLFYQSLATMLALVLPAFFIESFAAEWVPEFTLTMIWLVLAVSISSYFIMLLLIERLDATRVASLFYLGPPITMLMAWLIFGDIIKIMDIVGVAIVFVGVYLSNRTQNAK